jgi:DNA topoisomerase-1
MRNNKYITRHLNNQTKKYSFYINDYKITDRTLVEKLSKIYIAPAYKDVRIYLNKDIIATGIDDAGRKQYIYSEDSKKKRETKKLNSLIKLSNHIFRLKNKINNDLNQENYTKEKVIALILKIMDLCNFRGGTKKYEKKYGSHGITTLHKRHILFKKDLVEIEFIGKKGVNNYCSIDNKKVVSILKDIYKLSDNSNPYLFSIHDNNTGRVSVTLSDVNKYLEQFDISAKDLRTWNANIIFLKGIRQEFKEIYPESYELKTDEQKLRLRKKVIRSAIERTAESLHHTATICKNSYIDKNIQMRLLESDFIMKKLVSKKNIEFELFLKNLLEKNKSNI